MLGRKCVIVGAGEMKVQEMGIQSGLAEKFRLADLVIGVDGGLTYLNKLGLEADYLIGDFDSVSKKDRELIEDRKRRKPEQVLELKPEKDDTDMLAALRLGLELGCSSFDIYAGMGGRLDHTIANIQCLLFLKHQGAVGRLVNDQTEIFVLKDEEVSFDVDTKGLLSLFTLGEKAEGVSIRGMKYPLKKFTMRNDYPIGISNEFIGEECHIEVRHGELLCILQKA